MFGNYWIMPFELKNPGAYTESCGRDLELKNGDLSYRGWHFPANCSLQTKYDRLQVKNFTRDSRPIVIYYHGVGDTRAYKSRTLLYKRLAAEMNFHVITFDYAGYGDSTWIRPNKQSVFADAAFMYKWLLKQDGVTPQRVTVWGHSLGTSISTHMVSELTTDMKPKNLILESPFDTIANVVNDHPMAIYVKFKPLSYIFETFYVDTLKVSEDVNFDTTLYLENLDKVHILIMHALDDLIIAYKLGRNLYNLVAKKYGNKQVEMVTVDGEKGLGHLYLAKDDETLAIANKLIDSKASRL